MNDGKESDMEKRELKSMEKLFEAFRSVGRTAMDFSENLDRVTKIMKKDAEKLEIKINDDLSGLKPLGIKVTDQDGNIYVGETNDWKILDVNCLEPDILVGDYEFEDEIGIKLSNEITSRINILKDTVSDLSPCKYSYRPTPSKKSHEELEPTREEILSKWWDFGKRGYLRVLHCDGNQYTTFDPLDSNFITWHKENFTGRKSMESE